MNKLRTMLKKENGFTLVELLAVIVILGIIVAIAIPAIGNIIQRAGVGASEAEQELVIDAARLFATTENISGDFSVTADTLDERGFLDLRSGEDIDGGAVRTDGVYTFDEELSSDVNVPTGE